MRQVGLIIVLNNDTAIYKTHLTSFKTLISKSNLNLYSNACPLKPVQSTISSIKMEIQFLQMTRANHVSVDLLAFHVFYGSVKSRPDAKRLEERESVVRNTSAVSISCKFSDRIDD